MRQGTSRRRHRARSSRGWFAATAAAVAVVAVISWVSQSPGSDRTQNADGRITVTAGPSSGSSGGAAPELGGTGSGTSSPSAGATTRPPTGKAGGPAHVAKTVPPKAVTHKPTPPVTTPPVKAGPTVNPPAAPAGQRSIAIVNRTQQTMWAVVTNTAVYPRGHKLAPGQSFSLTVGNSWGGRIWGRTGCSGDASGKCLTGDCTTTCGGPVTPTTLGEFTFNAFDGMDFYDVSMVDGSNLPMYINISHTTGTDPVTGSGCYKGTCTSPVNCPSAMQAKNGSQVIGCKPPCAAFGGDTYCCRGAWAGRDKCVPSKWPVDYTQVFKKAEPYAYSYAFDDSATMACKGGCYYRITFGTT